MWLLRSMCKFEKNTPVFYIVAIYACIYIGKKYYVAYGGRLHFFPLSPLCPRWAIIDKPVP